MRRLWPIDFFFFFSPIKPLSLFFSASSHNSSEVHLILPLLGESCGDLQKRQQSSTYDANLSPEFPLAKRKAS